MDWWVWAIGIVLVLAFIGYLMGPQRDKPITKRDHRILESPSTHGRAGDPPSGLSAWRST